MTQYLLSVHDPEGGRPELSESEITEITEITEIVADVDRFNEDLKTGGSWVFAGGLEEPSTAMVVDATGSDVLVTDVPYAEAKEQLGVLGHRGPGPGRRAGARQARIGGLPGAVEVRPFQSE